MVRNKIPPKKKTVQFADQIESALEIRKSRGELKTFGT